MENAKLVRIAETKHAVAMPTASTHAAVATVIAGVVVMLVADRLRRRKKSASSSSPEPSPLSGPPSAVSYGDITIRQAVQGDLPHLEAVSNTSGQKIVPGGGDFVVHAWQSEWWTLDPRTHWNCFAFAGDAAVAFARVEAYGPSDALESGWLMAMRVRPEFQGQRVMARLQAHLLGLLPTAVRSNLYLAVGSTNENMRNVCEPRYEFYGTYVLQNFMSGAMLRADRERYAALLSIQPLKLEDGLDDAWAFLTGCVEANPKLLVPGRYYDFRAPTRGALEDKVRSGRATVARDGATIVALFFQFDNDMPDDNGGLRRIYTCCAAVGLDAAKLGSTLLAFGKTHATTDATSGLAMRPQLSVGPCVDKDGRDVEPKMAIALTAGNYTRPRSTHLRVYRVGVKAA